MKENAVLKNIPEELKYNGLWCCWKLTPKGKVPYNVKTGGFAKSNDKSTFVTYFELLHHLQDFLQYEPDGKQTGGIGLGIFNGFSAVDIDHCINDDGEISKMAQDIIDYCQSYTEYSPSGHGIRIIFKTNQKIDKNNYYINNAKIGLEIYISDNTNKFVTITGNSINKLGINNVEINYILDKYMVKNAIVNTRDPLSIGLEKDSKLRDLWYSQASGFGGNENNIDEALCCKLAYYLKNDVDAINNAFISSPYFASKDKTHKDKWLVRQDYRENTIKKAISLVEPAVVDYEIKQSNYKTVKHYALNDTGNAHRFVDKFGSNIRYNVENKKWMIWNGKYWQTDVSLNVKNFVEIMAEEMSMEARQVGDELVQKAMQKNITHIYNRSGKENLLSEAQHRQGIPVLNSDFDSNAFLLCCNNGVVDLKTGKMHEHIKEEMISMSTNHDIDLEHEPVRWVKFVNEIFNGDKELARYIQKICGYAISNSTREQCMFVLYGDGRNGKSLLLDIIREALGSYSITTRPQLLTEQRNGNTNMDEIARLKGKRFIVSEEAKIGDKLDESLIKTLTSGLGNIVAKFLYGDSFEFAVTGKIFMATNHRPVIRGNDNGIWRRIHVIPFDRIFKDSEDDKNLRFTLQDEIPQILGWLVKGCLMWQEEGIEPPDKVKNSTKEYRVEMDIIQRWIDDRCEVGNDYYEKATMLFDDFNAYCIRDKEFQMSNTLFGRNMSKKFDKKRFGGGYVYYGIRLKQGQENLKREVAYDKATVDPNI